MYLVLRNTKFRIDGMHLLALCEKLAKEAVNDRVVPGAGTKEQPFVPRTMQDWLNASQRMRNSAGSGNDNVYFDVAGRLLHKNVKVYISDIGPVWRKGLLPNDLKGVVDRHLLEHSTCAVNDLAAWKQTNLLADPTYQIGAQRIDDPGKIFPNNRGHYTKQVPSWNTLEKTPIVAKAMRNLMQGSFTLAAGRDYSRMQHGLPVFVAAIFLAEPSRNIRAWPINLMLLDIAERGTPGFTWGEILWHPLALHPVNPQQALDPTGPALTGPVGTPEYAEQWATAVSTNDRPAIARLSKTDRSVSRAMGPVTRLGQLHLLGGRMPSSPTKGGEIGKGALYGGIKLKNVGSDIPQQTVSLGNIPFDYIHRKEIEVLCTWLMAFPDIAHEWELADLRPQAGFTDIDVGIVFGANSSTDPRSAKKNYPPTLDIKVFSIRNKIDRRIRSLDLNV